MIEQAALVELVGPGWLRLTVLVQLPFMNIQHILTPNSLNTAAWLTFKLLHSIYPSGVSSAHIEPHCQGSHNTYTSSKMFRICIDIYININV